MTWTKTLPAAQGRYWWRCTDKWQRQLYGMILWTWTEPSLVRAGIEPELRIRNMLMFNSGYSGELDGGGWGAGGGYSAAEVLKQYPGIEFWDVAEVGPESFLPALPPKPDWTPPDPVVVAAQKVAADKKRAAEDKAEKEAWNTRIAAARAKGATLYRCESCHEVYDEEQLVVVRECPHCEDAKFDGTENGQACPDCNRRFTRKLCDKGCPECLEEDDCVPVEETVPATPTPEPAKKKRRGR